MTLADFGVDVEIRAENLADLIAQCLGLGACAKVGIRQFLEQLCQAHTAMLLVIGAEPVMGLDRPREKIVNGRIRSVSQLAGEAHPIDMNSGASLQAFSLEAQFDFVAVKDEGRLGRPGHTPLPVKVSP